LQFGILDKDRKERGREEGRKGGKEGGKAGKVWEMRVIGGI
jgi:hypothetical protein